MASRERAAAWLSAERTVAIAGTTFAAVFSLLAALKYHNFGSSRFNLGNFVQAVWSTAHGRPFEMTADTGEQFVRLGAHVEPILLLFAPAWRVWPSPVMLLVVQAVALASGIFPVFWLARKHLGVAAGRRVALAYLFYPSVSLLTINEFHAVALAIPFLLFAAWYLDEGRLLPFAIWAVLAMSTKEQIGLAVAGMGIWYALRHRRVRAGAITAGAGLLWSSFAFLVVIPHFSPTGQNPFVGRYADLGGSPSGIAESLVTSPSSILDALAQPLNAVYLVALLIPVAGICLLAPIALIPAVPELFINLLSTHFGQKTVGWQYVAGIVPFIFLATIYGLRSRPRKLQFLSRLVVMAALLNFLISITYIVSAVRAPMDRDTATTALRLIPPDVPVSASGHFGVRLSDRERILNFPTVGEADWIILYRGDIWIPWPVEEPDEGRWNQAVHRYERSPDWRVAFDRDGVLVLNRRQ